MIRHSSAADPPRWRPWTSAAALCTVLSAMACTCNGSERPGTTAGELGNGIFGYRCVDDTDGACPGGGEKPADFPLYIAVGSRFAMVYEPLEGSRTLQLRSPTSQLDFDGQAFIATVPGWAAIAAYDGDDVFDLLHVEVVEPTVLTMEVDRAPLAIGDERPMIVDVRNAEGDVVAGALPYTWSVDPPGVLALEGEEPSARLRAVGVAAGLATIEVTDGRLGVSVALEVLPGDAPTGTTGATGSTADTGSER